MVSNLRISVVFDTNTIISSLIFGGHLAPLANMMVNRQLNAFTTHELLEELSRVLGYPKILQVLSKRGLKAENIIRLYVKSATIIMAKPLDDIVIVDDPADDAVLACALTAGVEYIISGDAHLKDLGCFRGIPILTPAQFLKRNSF